MSERVKKKCVRNLIRDPKGKDHVEDLDTDWRATLKCILNWAEGYIRDSSG